MENRPIRLYDQSLLAMIKNSVGANTFRNFYVQLADGAVTDAMNDGSDSCAFFVSSLLCIVKRGAGMHGTVESTLADMKQTGWESVNPEVMMAGDVLVWEPKMYDGKPQEHIGFYIGDGKAVSTSMHEKCVVEHDANFGGERKIMTVYRYNEQKKVGSN